MARFREAVVEEAARGRSAPGSDLRRSAIDAGVTSVVLVEGVSDQVALEALAVRRGRDLDAHGVCVVALGGATSIRRFLGLLGPSGLDLRLLGLCDIGEERHFRRGLELAGLGHDLAPGELEQLGFFVCVADLEDELIRALGPDSVVRVIEAEGDLKSFRTLQSQPVQRSWTVEQQLHRFMGSIGGRKERYARALVEAVDLDRVPPPLDRLLDAI
jgi:hypothetical protein